MSDELDDDTRDHLVALTRGAANAVPFIGGLLGELITATIPQQRKDRIVRYLRELGARMEKLESGVAKSALQNPEKIDLIETGGYQSVRATSQDRIEQIAEVVANGLTADDADIVRRKRLLALLGEIDDDEVAILAAYGQSYASMNPQAWESIDRPSPPHLQAGREVIEASKLYDLGVNRLLRLDLLERRLNLKKGQIPEFDNKTGMPKGPVQISYLGRMLLRSMDIELPFAE